MSERPHLVLADAVRLWAGAERFVLDAADGLRRRGWRVTVQAYPGSPLQRRAEERGLAVHAVRTRADGAPWTVIPLRRWLRRARVDAVLTSYEKDLRTVGWAAHLQERPIAVVHSRECDVPLKDRPHYRYFYNRVAHHVLANSRSTRERTLASAPWLDPARVSVLPKGVDLEHLAGIRPTPRRESLGLRPDETLWGFVGQLVPRKRVHRLLEALAAPGLRERPWHLLVVGEGPERDRLEAQAARLGIGPRVHFDGFAEDPGPSIAALDALVLPSLVEGFGYVLAEAAALGRPSVAYGSSSVPEVVRDGETGLLVDPTRENGLRDALLRLVDDPPLRRRLGEAAARHARRELGLDTMLDRLEDRLRRQIAIVRDPQGGPR